MNDENLEMYLYQQFNTVLDSNLDYQEKQQKLGQLFLNASNSISAIYLVNHEEEAKEMLKMIAGGEQKVDINFKSLLKNEWYIYTNIAIWIDFLHSVFNEIQSDHPQYHFFSQVMDSINGIELQLGIHQERLVS